MVSVVYALEHTLYTIVYFVILYIYCLEMTNRTFLTKVENLKKKKL